MLSLKLLLLSSPEEELVFSQCSQERWEGPGPSNLTPWRRRKGRSPKCPEAAGPDHGLLYTKLPAGFQASSLAQKSSRVTFK